MSGSSLTRTIAATIATAGILLSLGASPAYAAGRYYPETGHTVDARFLPTFDQLGGGAVLGFPITEPFYQPDGRMLQYFENARLELAPDEAGEALEVRLSPLGVIMGGWDLPLEQDRLPIGSSAGCRYFEPTGHQVCHSFLEFFEAHGGPDVFGYPITEFRLEGGRIVQYFQSLRLDWYPEAEQGSRIRPGPLGRQHFDLMGHDRSLLDPVPPPEGAAGAVRQLRAHPSVWKPLTSGTDSQQVYLLVSDQHMRPVEGAAVLLTMYLPAGSRMQMMPATDSAGVTQTALSFQDLPVGTRVDLEYVVLFRDLTALTRDSFFIWY